MDYIMEVRHANKKLDKKLIINQVSFQVKKGDIYGLVGKNGAGKTTLMRMMLSMLHTDSGEIKIVPRMKQENKIGAMIENPAFYPLLDSKREFRLLSKTKKYKRGILCRGNDRRNRFKGCHS